MNLLFKNIYKVESNKPKNFIKSTNNYYNSHGTIILLSKDNILSNQDIL